MSLLQKVSVNLIDLVTFGPRFWLRHAPRITGASTVRVHIPDIGLVHVRAGHTDVLALRQVFQKRDYDIGADHPIGRRISARYKEILRRDLTPIIVDAGANIGAAALWFLKEYPMACVVAIEPEPGNVAVLRKNAFDNPRLIALDSAVGSTAGFVSIEGTGMDSRTTRTEAGVPIMTMDQAFQCLSNGCPFIAKIDIEGFEDDLFSQNLDWLDKVYVVYLEAHDWLLPGKRTSRNFQRAMAQHDFEILIKGENFVYVRVD